MRCLSIPITFGSVRVHSTNAETVTSTPTTSVDLTVYADPRYEQLP